MSGRRETKWTIVSRRRRRCRGHNSPLPPWTTTITWTAALMLTSLATAVPGATQGGSPREEAPSIMASYTTFNESVNFTHFAVDTSTGKVYVGATNWLYQFNASLDLEASVQTGPVEDSVLCSPSDCTGVETELTDNINKVRIHCVLRSEIDIVGIDKLFDFVSWPAGEL